MKCSNGIKMKTDPDELKLVTGLVKWFDQSKGFGFIISDEVASDILLHANVLRNFGRNSVADQSQIVIMAHPTPRGYQAAEIIKIVPPASDGVPPISDLPPDLLEKLDTLPIWPGRVKWFDRAKGFGFANIFGRADDVFVHIEVLRHSGFADMTIGEAIGLRVVDGPRGLIAAEVTSWDKALPADARDSDADTDQQPGTFHLPAWAIRRAAE